MINLNAVLNLIEHEKETGIPLPLNERHIAALEHQGYIVDLVSGEVFKDPDFTNNTELAKETVQMSMLTMPSRSGRVGAVTLSEMAREGGL